MDPKNVKKFVRQFLIGLFSLSVLLFVIAIIGSRVDGFGVRRSAMTIVVPNVTTIAGPRKFRR